MIKAIVYSTDERTNDGRTTGNDFTIKLLAQYSDHFT